MVAVVAAERLLTPSKITAWLDCAHYLALQHRVEDGAITKPGTAFGSFAQLLADKGLLHETACLAEYERQGKSILRVPDRQDRETFNAWVARVGDPFDEGWDVVYQMPFVHDGVRGIADFLIRVEDPDTGAVSYEPVDAKLARAEAKPGHVLQLCFYADAIEATTGVRPARMHLWLGSGNVETLTVREFRPYWNRIREQLARVLAADPANDDTSPEPCNHCAFCEFFDQCTEEWRERDSLVYVAGLRSAERLVLEQSGVPSLQELAECVDEVDGIRAERLARLVNQATLQAAARLAEDAPPPFDLIEAGDDPLWGRGFELLPEPDDGDVFLDFEGHPFWRADTGLFFLFGLILRDAEGEWRYKEWWAHDVAEEAEAAAAVIDFLAARRDQYPAMHVYHYNHTERSSLERLAAVHGVREVLLEHLVQTGLFVDLLVVARNAMQVGTESYGLKYLERLTDYERGHDIDQGAAAVVEYERFMADGDEAALRSIAAYNADDVRATRALRDWLVDHRPPGREWRPAVLEPDEGIPELDEQVARLHEFDLDSPEHFLGDVLGYWRREWRAHLAPLLVKSQADPTTLFEDPDVLTALVPVGVFDRYGKNGNVLKRPAMRFSVPEQENDAFRDFGVQVVFTTADGGIGYSSIDRLDREAGTLDLLWSEENEELDSPPAVVVLNDWVSPKPKPAALSDFAARVLDPAAGAPNPVSLALLRRDLPKFVAGGGPPGGRFSDDLDEMHAWATQLDRSLVAIQGPPGTGKTFRGAHLVRTLVRAGKRVGITAMSHHAIDNLLDEVKRLFTEQGELDRLHVVRRVPASDVRVDVPGVKFTKDNKVCARSEYNVVAGTTWLFSGNDMKAAPVDVLIIDEAGQLALADALAASRSARNLILLGDPLQLPQVAQAAHPHGSGCSVLEHLLGDDVTMPEERGVFLTETRRMHPDVCRFISDEIYEGRLLSHPSCEQQTTEFGTGLRWLPAVHEERTTESIEEAELVADEIERLLGTAWTNQHGEAKKLTVHDFMVVAPYNDQVDLISEVLDERKRTRGTPVGTVDKFQGRQSAVVFFTMTTSSGDDMTRTADFLFSRNRLNVAISRARCLAYLVCTEALLDSRARDVPEMRLIATLCSFVEYTRAQD